jgi:hypothetical protein
MPTIAPKFKFEYFPRGADYSAQSESQRFRTVDYNMQSYVAVIGVGVISGWTIEQTTDREIQILPGRGIINGFFAESPYTIKQRSELVSGEREVEVIKLQQAPQEDMTTAEANTYISVVQEYDSSFSPDTPIENAYIKVVIPHKITLVDNKDTYIWVTRKHTNYYPALSDYPAYLLPEPEINDYGTYDEYAAAAVDYNAQMATIYNYQFRDDSDNHFTEVNFNTAFSFNPTSSKVLLGLVTTRDNEVTFIDTSNVKTVDNLQETITSYANKIVAAHHHGGSAEYDPAKVNLETDIRRAYLTSYTPENRQGVFSVVESQLSDTVEGHRHTFTVDANGNGQTVGIVGTSPNHFHKIVNGVVQTQEFTNETVADHAHTLPDTSNFTWNSDSEYIVYVNGVSVGDENSTDITANSTKNTITLTGIIGGVTRTYGLDFTFDGKQFKFEKQQNSVYWFMLDAIKEFNTQFPNVSVESNPFVFYDEETNTVAGIEDLRVQSVTAESLLQKTGDKFTFTPNAAQNIEVTLVNYQKTVGLEADKVTIEILGNSEVTGLLGAENILFINAEKVTTGVFEIAQIPFLSHVGRINEIFAPRENSLISRDGFKFLATPSLTTTVSGHYHNVIVNDKDTGLTEKTFVNDEPVLYAFDNDGNEYLVGHTHSVASGTVSNKESSGLLSWQNAVNGTSGTDSSHTHELIYPLIGNSKVIYSIYEDRFENLYLGTSDDLIMIPKDDAYIFVINDIPFYEHGTDLLTMFESAKLNYENKVGVPLRIKSDLYTAQIAIAEDELDSVGDSYLITGKSETNSDPDKTMIQRIAYIPVPNYKSSVFKDFSEIGDNDIIVGVSLVDASSCDILDPTSSETKEKVSDDSDSVKTVAEVETSYKDIPAISIEVQEVVTGNKTDDKILTVGGKSIAVNTNIYNNFYFDWSSPSTPATVGAFRNAEQDEDGSVWVASDSGVWVMRSHNETSLLSQTSVPGLSLNIQDILVLSSDKVFCVSDDGIFKTEDLGKTWVKKQSGSFLQIVEDLGDIEVSQNYGHVHTLDVNIHGNGTLTTNNGHSHTVTNWSVSTNLDEHSHELIFTLYAKTSDSIYRSNDSGETWILIRELPDGESGKIFAYNKFVYLAKPEGTYRLSNLWEKINSIIPYSFQTSYDLSKFYIGSSGKLYSATGSTFTEINSLSGNPTPMLTLNDEKQYFGYSYSNRGKSFYLNNSKVTDQNFISQVSFEKWVAPEGSWGDDILYDVYVDDKLVLSTKENIDKKDDRNLSFTVDNDNGIIDFGEEASLSSKLDVYDNFIEVDDSGTFKVGDLISIRQESVTLEFGESSSEIKEAEELVSQSLKTQSVDNAYFYATVTLISGNSMYFSPRSTVSIDIPAKVYKIPSLDYSSEILLNIYDSHLYNIGTNSHEDLENSLSYESDQRPYFLNNSYLSNLLQLTQAVIYAKPGIDSSMVQTKFYDFHYSEDVSDEFYYGNYIDISNSEAFSLVSFSNPFIAKKSASINKILIGSGAFLGNIIVATDIGVFWAKSSDNINANWFYSFGLTVPVYDLIVFGEDNLLAATDNGVYITTDMQTWTLETQEAIQFPSLTMSLRWSQENYTVIESHTATFYNVGDGPIRGRIETTGSIYENIPENRSIKIEILSDTTNSKHNTSHLVTKVYPNSIQVSPSFETVPETLTQVRLTIGSWWQQFSGEDNASSSSLNNTLMVGGRNKIAYTPYIDGFIWNESLIGENIVDINVLGFLPLSTGGILANASGTNPVNVTNYILRSTDIGKIWNSYRKFDEIQGKVISSKLTSFSHTEIKAEYTKPSDFRYSNGELDKRRVSFFLEGGTDSIFDGKVVGNDGKNSTITIFGTKAKDILNTNENVTFEVYPITTNRMIETSDNNILFGTDAGIYEDSKTTTGEFPFEGQVWSVGIQGRVNNIDVSGTIKSAKEDSVTNNVVVSIGTSASISKNQFKDESLYILDSAILTKYKILNNSSRTIGGEISVEIDLVFSSDWLTNVGKDIKLVPSQSFLDVDFDFLTTNNQLAGGTITLSTNENNNYGRVYNVVSNTNNRIFVDESIIPYNVTSPDPLNTHVIAGQQFVGLDNSGVVPLDVTFTKSVTDNYLTDFNFKVSNSDSVAFETIGMKLYQNFRNKIELKDFSSLITSGTPVALFIKPNDIFRVTGPIYQPLATFNNRRTSVESAHYHELDLIGTFVEGVIDSFTTVKNATVKFEVGDSNLFSSSIVQQDGTLFKEARIRFFNPQQVGVEYFSEVIEHDSTSMTVKLLNNTNWDFSAYSELKISTTWKWEIDATNYGYTESIFYDDFIVSSQSVTQDISISDQFVYVNDTSEMTVGDKILIISDSDKSEENFIKSVIDSTQIELSTLASNNYLTKNIVNVKVLRDEFSNTHQHMVRNNQVETISVEDYLNRGYPPQHSHRNTALIDVVSDIQKENGQIFAIGSTSFVYNSTSNGTVWKKQVDLNDFVEENLEIQGLVDLDFKSGQIVVGTTNGEIFSNGEEGVEILPLTQPSVS